MSEESSAPEWQRGVLASCALGVLARGSAHGYAVAQRVQAAGVGPVKGGAFYPVLSRLEQDGLLTSAWQEGRGGPGRKVFTLTPAGHSRLEELRRQWRPFAAAVDAVLDAEPSTAALPALDGEARPADRVVRLDPAGRTS